VLCVLYLKSDKSVSLLLCVSVAVAFGSIACERRTFVLCCDALGSVRWCPIAVAVELIEHNENDETLKPFPYIYPFEFDIVILIVCLLLI